MSAEPEPGVSLASAGLLGRVPILALISVAWLVPAALAVIDAYVQGRLVGEPTDSRFLMWIGGDWLIYGALTPLVFRIAQRLPLRRGVLTRHLTINFLLSLVFCALWAGAGTLLRHALIPGPGGTISWRGTVSWFFTTLPFGVAVYFAVLGVEHATHYFRVVRERDTQASRMAAQLAEARLGALRMQLHPHFLFNSLNAIGVLVRDNDTAGASRMLELLSDVLRQVLTGTRVQDTTLAAEISFIQNYLAVEQIRFADRLHVVYDVDPQVLTAIIPAFILQPIVENAMRHGIARRSEAGTVTIAARREGDDLVLVVTDDGPGPAESTAAPTGVGLANTRTRLATLYGERGRLSLVRVPSGGAAATIRLPYRTGPVATEGGRV
jgi:signal transduction histidine kinase